ncbi:MAG: NifU N-terminal domain-containing protein [Anaerolineae bacterium]|nr:NifU N-terminal domain-containing protein [Anaerolineae bacterium]
MSEYVKIETEPTGDPDVLEIITNQVLTTAETERYPTFDEGNVGSPIAQMLFDGVPGIRALTITPDTLVVTRDPDTAWEEIVDDVRDALRDFFL